MDTKVEYPHELMLKYEALERAAIALSDALTGGGVYAIHGRDTDSILMRVRRQEDGIAKGIVELNDALRDLSRGRYDAQA